MAENFDPYRKWLGIPPEEQPPNYYRLLGIALYEDDLDVITHAADRQMSHVRKFQSGQHGQHSQQVLNELAKARVCLLDRAQKIAYDQELHQKLGGEKRLTGAPVAAPRASQTVPIPSRPQQAPSQPAPPPLASVATMEPPAPVATAHVPLATPVATANPVGVGSRPVRTATARARRKASPLPLVLTICGLAGVAALAAIVAIVSSNGPEDEGSEEVATQIQNPPETFATPPESAQDADKPVRPPKRNPSDRPSRERPPRERPPRETKVDDDPEQPDRLIIPDNPENDVDEDAPSLPTITRHPSDDPPTDDPDDETSTDDPAASTNTPEENETDDDETDSDEPCADEPDEADDTDIANDPQRGEKFSAAVVAIEDAFSRRDLKEAARQLATARRLMEGDAEELQVAALSELMSHLGTFWRLATTAARKLQPGDELEFGGEAATFDSFNDGDVALVVGGSRLSRPLEDLELHYAVALAARGTPKADSKSRLAIAAFLAVDGNASEPERRDAAKTVLAEAISLGGRSPALEQRLGETPAP